MILGLGLSFFKISIRFNEIIQVQLGKILLILHLEGNFYILLLYVSLAKFITWWRLGLVECEIVSCPVESLCARQNRFHLFHWLDILIDKWRIVL